MKVKAFALVSIKSGNIVRNDILDPLYMIYSDIDVATSIMNRDTQKNSRKRYTVEEVTITI